MITSYSDLSGRGARGFRALHSGVYQMRVRHMVVMLIAIGIIGTCCVILRRGNENEQRQNVRCSLQNESPSQSRSKLKETPKLVHEESRLPVQSLFSPIDDVVSRSNPLGRHDIKSLNCRSSFEIVRGFIANNPNDTLTRKVAEAQLNPLDLDDIFESLYEQEDPNIRHQCIRLAYILIQGNDMESARWMLDRLLERDPLNMDAIRGYALLFENDDNIDGYVEFL